MAHAGGLPSRRVAIVDDDVSALRSLQRLLKAAGFETETFTSAEQFLEESRDTIGCLVVDIGLPGMSGIELCRRRRAMRSTAPVIVMTAQDGDQLRRDAFEAGAFAFLRKPVGLRELVTEVGNAFEACSSDVRG
jgi:two-component system response regulator FixJ